MNRRDFLKGIGAAIIGAIVPKTKPVDITVQTPCEPDYGEEWEDDELPELGDVTAMAVEDNGTIWVSDDYGDSWREVEDPGYYEGGKLYDKRQSDYVFVKDTL